MANLNRPVLRWGVLGGGKIAHDWILALDHTQRPHKVVAVAASSSERAQKLINDCKLKEAKAYGRYDALLADPNVDIVYIALHNEAHCPWSVKALEAGKHVLTEKPMGVNAKEARETIELAKRKNLFFMEGFWSRFFPVWQQIRKTIDTKELGMPKVAHAAFGYPHEDNWRCAERGESPLTLYALYTIMFVQWVFGRKADKIRVIGAKDKFDVDDWASIVLEYGEDSRGVCYYDSKTFLPQNAFVSFEKGQIQLPGYFWSPEKMIKITGPYWYTNTDIKEFEYPLKDDRFFNYNHSSGFRYEQDHVYDLLQSGATESNVMSFKDTLDVLEMMDEVRRQLGVEFPHDKK